MGYSKYTYVGPYIDVTSLPKYKKEESKIYSSCLNNDCESYHKNLNENGQFCSLCGQKRENYLSKNIVDKIKNIKDILYEFGDVDILFQIGESERYGPNRRGKYHENSDEDFTFDIDVNFIPNALKEFESEYSKSLKYLKDNDVTFDIKFGVISYYW